jgi:hypothetical protein
MMNCKNLGTQQARIYYRDGAYQEGKWWGKGAIALGLQGELDVDAYWNLLEGKRPSGRGYLTGRKVNPQQRRAAIDCVFSAPKSVSITALVAGDEGLITAQERAVNQTLADVEALATTRLKERDVPMQQVNTQNLIVATFTHIEGRGVALGKAEKDLFEDIPEPYRQLNDPHLHTHCVVLNLTRLEDGRWRSLHNDPIYTHQKRLGLAYRQNLAREVEQLGYATQWEGDYFEIAGYERKDILTFSKRRRQILARTGQGATVAQRQKAWALGRLPKGKIILGELREKWCAIALAVGMTFATPSTVIANQPSTNQPSSNQPGGVPSETQYSASEVHQEPETEQAFREREEAFTEALLSDTQTGVYEPRTRIEFGGQPLTNTVEGKVSRPEAIYRQGYEALATLVRQNYGKLSPTDLDVWVVRFALEQQVNPKTLIGILKQSDMVLALCTSIPVEQQEETISQYLQQVVGAAQSEPRHEHRSFER